jgi:hypothetical protein
MGRASTTAFVGILFAIAATLTSAQSKQPQGPAEAASEWVKGNRVLLGVTQEGAGFSAQWRFQRSAHGDIVLDLEETRAGQMRAGSLVLVQNGALLARDIPLERGRELDAFNGPLLMLQLVLRVLERAAPGGPQSIKAETKIDLSERDKPVKVSGIGAEGEFFAPWSAKGVLGPAPGGQIRFELQFVSSSRARSGVPYQSHIVGIWNNAPPPVQLPDSMSLRGWRGFQIKPAVKARGAVNSVGLGTSPPMAFTNMGEVRLRVAQWADEGARRARWQCS